jgi:broad specificity phosphatase PhoE
MADELYVVRHGQRQDSVDPEWEAVADRVHDPPLTELGRWAAWRVGRRFAEAGTPFDAVYASPFRRTVETADEVCRELETTFELEPGLGEYHNPEWFDRDPETLPAEDLRERFGTLRLGRDPHVVPAFPESHDEAIGRIATAARQLADGTEGSVLLVGHGITVAGVVGGLVGSAAEADAPLCGVTRLVADVDGTWRLDYTGDTSHLDV